MGNYNRDSSSRPRRDFGRSDFRKRSFGGDDRRREMHKVVCSNCGKDCEVPFKPTNSKPVYCNECFRKMGGGRDDSRRFQDRESRRPSFERRSEPRPQNNEQFETINRKLDKILEMITVVPEKLKGTTLIDKKKIKSARKSPAKKK